MAWTGIAAALVVVGVLLWVALLGDDGQRDTALILAGYTLTGGGFLGLGYFLGSRNRSRS